MSSRVEDLAPDVVPRANALAIALAVREIPAVVSCTRRTVDEQIALYAQGRTTLEIVNLLRLKAGMPGPLSEKENAYTVTNCDGVNRPSPHQSGRAMDIVPRVEKGSAWNYAELAREYKAIGEVARSLGWKCGQDWPPIDPATGLGKDPPHYEV